VGLDGVPVGSQDGTKRGQTITQKHILIPPAGRAEFIVNAPSPWVKDAVFQTRNIETGPAGDNDPARPLAVIKTVSHQRYAATDAATEGTFDSQPWALPLAEDVKDAVRGDRFAGLAAAKPNKHRKLYFSEVISDPNDPASPTNFFITVDGATPTMFSAANPPAIVTKQGSVEDWTIENRSPESHEFHMHQIHFLLLAVNGVPVPESQRQYYDMYQVPFWNGSGPYPSITVRMDFRGPDVGDFVYHCHILGHEDNGMMATIRVLP
jgi:FtsP/CotA-like multicopper oxidase with cupredoxin domain